MSECPKLYLPEFDADLEVADLCMGCFWAPDLYFSGVDGVLEVIVGYSGGTRSNPTYKNLKDHTETVRIVFDPNEIDYEEILVHFASQGGLTDKRELRNQYRRAIFYHNRSQKAIAEDFIIAMQRAKRAQYTTDIQPASDFYMAEEYHQKYLEKKKARKSQL